MLSMARGVLCIKLSSMLYLSCIGYKFARCRAPFCVLWTRLEIVFINLAARFTLYLRRYMSEKPNRMTSCFTVIPRNHK